MAGIFWTGIVIGVVILIGALAFIRNKSSRLPVPIEVQLLTLSDVIKFFKQPEVSGDLKSDGSVVAVAIREGHMTRGLQIILCLYDKTRAAVITKKARVYNAVEIDAPLATAFGEKNMLVLG